MNDSIKSLIFVYNANSGTLNALFDIGHKLISPDTYDCKLCSLTHSAFAERKAWKEFRENNSIKMEFLHKDEFEQQYEPRYEYPVVLLQTGAIKELLNREAIAAQPDIESLISAIVDRLADK